MSGDATEVERISLKDESRKVEFNITPGIQVSIELGGMKGRIVTTLVGMEQDKNIILSIPMLAGIRENLHEGNRVVARYLNHGTVYGFQSVVLSHITKPSSLLFIAYPKVIEVINLRKHQRADCYFRAVLEMDEWRYQGMIVDISIGGCKFVAGIPDSGEPFQINVGSSLRLQCVELCPRPFFVSVVAMSKDRKKITAGLSFTSLDQQQFKGIMSYVEEVLKYELFH